MTFFETFMVVAIVLWVAALAFSWAMHHVNAACRRLADSMRPQ